MLTNKEIEKEINDSNYIDNPINIISYFLLQTNDINMLKKIVDKIMISSCFQSDGVIEDLIDGKIGNYGSSNEQDDKELVSYVSKMVTQYRQKLLEAKELVIQSQIKNDKELFYQALKIINTYRARSETADIVFDIVKIIDDVDMMCSIIDIVPFFYYPDKEKVLLNIIVQSNNEIVTDKIFDLLVSNNGNDNYIINIFKLIIERTIDIKLLNKIYKLATNFEPWQEAGIKSALYYKLYSYTKTDKTDKTIIEEISELRKELVSLWENKKIYHIEDPLYPSAPSRYDEYVEEVNSQISTKVNELQDIDKALSIDHSYYSYSVTKIATRTAMDLNFEKTLQILKIHPRGHVILFILNHNLPDNMLNEVLDIVQLLENSSEKSFLLYKIIQQIKDIDKSLHVASLIEDTLQKDKALVYILRKIDDDKKALNVIPLLTEELIKRKELNIIKT